MTDLLAAVDAGTPEPPAPPRARDRPRHPAPHLPPGAGRRHLSVQINKEGLHQQRLVVVDVAAQELRTYDTQRTHKRTLSMLDLLQVRPRACAHAGDDGSRARH